MLGQRRRSALKQHRAHVSRSLGNLHQSGFFQANFPRIERCIHFKKIDMRKGYPHKFYWWVHGCLY